MRINFRQGIISAQDEFGGFLKVNTTSVDLLVNNRQLTLTAAQSSHNYTFVETAVVPTGNAWVGTTLSGNYWLYFDYHKLTSVRSFGITQLEPVAQSVAPTSPLLDQHWYDTVQNRHYVWTGGSWVEVIRVFAAQLSDGRLVSMSNQAPSFYGTQIGSTASIRTGRVMFDESNNSVRRDDGTFITTEDQLFASGSRVDGIRLESNVDFTTFLGPGNSVSAYTVMAYVSNGTGSNVADYDDTGNTVLGMLTENLGVNEVGTVVLQGVVTNPIWNWDTVGIDLWVLNGNLVTVDPHVSPGPGTYPTARVPVARVVSVDTVVFEQGLGGVGARGVTGDTGAAGADGADGADGSIPAYVAGAVTGDWGTPTNPILLNSTLYDDVIDELRDEKAQKAPTYADIAAFPNATTVTGMIVHAVAEDGLYYSDGSVWLPLMEQADTFAMPYDLAFFVGGNVDTANGIVGGYIASRAVTITDFTSSVATANTGGTQVYIINKVVSGTPTQVGTLTFSGTTGVFALTAGAISLAVGNVLTIVNPASPSGTIADIAITIVGCALTTTSASC